MRVIGWLLGVAYFFAIVVFAVNNAEPVTLRLTSTVVLGRVPLVVVVLACFALGVVFGLAALAPKLIHLRRRLAQLRRPPAAGDRGADAAVERVDDRLASAARNVGAVGELDGDPPPRR